jgi:hypothetical protein
VTMLSLLLELVLIRWLASVFPVYSFYKNFTMLACFLGLGVSYLPANTALRDACWRSRSNKKPAEAGWVIRSVVVICLPERHFRHLDKMYHETFTFDRCHMKFVAKRAKRSVSPANTGQT